MRDERKGPTALSDLKLVLAAVCTGGLQMLAAALSRNVVITGRFVSGGSGCLFYWMSECKVDCRPALSKWLESNPLLTDEHKQAALRMVVGWDAQNPDNISKSAGYEDVYPAPAYTLTRDIVAEAIELVLKERKEANELEQKAIDAQLCRA